MWAVVGAIIIFFPILDKNSYHLYLLDRALIHSILATGLVFLTGFAGQISLGQAGFYALGAYSTAYFTTKLGLPLILGIILGIAISVVAGFLLSIPSFKLKAFFLSCNYRFRSNCLDADHKLKANNRWPIRFFRCTLIFFEWENA